MSHCYGFIHSSGNEGNVLSAWKAFQWVSVLACEQKKKKKDRKNVRGKCKCLLFADNITEAIS